MAFGDGRDHECWLPGRIMGGSCQITPTYLILEQSNQFVVATGHDFTPGEIKIELALPGSFICSVVFVENRGRGWLSLPHVISIQYKIHRWIERFDRSYHGF